MRVSPSARGGYGKGHGDAVVAAGVDGGAVEGLAAGHIEAVFKLFDFCSHGAEVLTKGDPVGLLDAKFLASRMRMRRWCRARWRPGPGARR